MLFRNSRKDSFERIIYKRKNFENSHRYYKKGNFKLKLTKGLEKLISKIFLNIFKLKLP